MFFNERKSIELVKILANNKHYYRIFPLIYLMDMKHLCRWGRPIIGDKYIAMENNPVPVNTYNMVFLPRRCDEFIIRTKKIVALTPINYRVFSITDLMVIEDLIKETKSFSVEQLQKKTRDKAWKIAKAKGTFLSYEDIGKVGGADASTLKYIKNSLLNYKLCKEPT